VRMTRAFLPRLKESDDARLVNVSSIFGVVAPPGQTAYCAAKFAVRGFSESLRHELEKTKVGVTVVHPGGVATQIAVNARSFQGESNEAAHARQEVAKTMLKMPPAEAGEIIVTGIEKRKVRVMVGGDAKQAALLERFMPTTYWSVISRNLMRHGRL